MGACDNTGEEGLHLEQIQILYTELATNPNNDFGWGRGKENARSLGYADEWLRRIPDAVWESAAAVGNPFSLGAIEKGQTVVDLGCGAGADACVAALLTGNQGHVIGIDCTPAMISRARSNAATAGFTCLEFYEADITSLPVADACADIVISNGAINLSTDKERVLAEAYRILRPCGRLQVADMVRDPSASAGVSCSEAGSWADCVAGTLAPGTFLSILGEAGFIDVELAGFTDYQTATSTTGALFRAVKPSVV